MEVFWSVALIVVSAGLINYNKFLMNPSMPLDRMRHEIQASS